MIQITMQKCDDGAIWVTSDEDQIGENIYVNNVSGENDEKCEFIAALAEYLNVAVAI